MTADPPLQLNIKFGPNKQYPEDMLNLRADTPQQFDNLLTYVTEHVQEIIAAGELLRAAAAATPVTDAAPAKPAQERAQQAWGGNSQPAVAGGSGDPSCVHGPRVFKQGTSKAGKPYKMWACSLRQGDPGKCDPQWA